MLSFCDWKVGDELSILSIIYGFLSHRLLNPSLRNLTDPHKSVGGLLQLNSKIQQPSRQCRRRWYTYLNSDFKKGGWTEEEDMILCQFRHRRYMVINRWTEIAKVVSGSVVIVDWYCPSKVVVHFRRGSVVLSVLVYMFNCLKKKRGTFVLAGPFPSSLDILASADYIFLTGNRLTGPVPKRITRIADNVQGLNHYSSYCCQGCSCTFGVQRTLLRKLQLMSLRNVLLKAMLVWSLCPQHEKLLCHSTILACSGLVLGRMDTRKSEYGLHPCKTNRTKMGLILCRSNLFCSMLYGAVVGCTILRGQCMKVISLCLDIWSSIQCVKGVWMNYHKKSKMISKHKM